MNHKTLIVPDMLDQINHNDDDDGDEAVAEMVKVVTTAAMTAMMMEMTVASRPLPWGLRGGGCCHGEGMVVCGVAADCGWGQGRSDGGGVSGVGNDDGDGVRWRYGGEVGRVGESDIRDRVDRKVGSIFGFAGKSLPEKFSGGVQKVRVVCVLVSVLEREKKVYMRIERDVMIEE
nr:hypothetical protein [Tanacetum cinerariifolium]